jgi:hypothetical protein
MTFPIGPRAVATQPPQLTVPGSNASTEVLEAFKQSLSALAKHDRYASLHKEFVGAASGDLQTVSRFNPMLDGRDHRALSEALEAAAANGYFEIMKMILKDRAWLWASDKFTVMACIVENYDRGNPADCRKAFMDLFSHVPLERRIVRGFGDVDAYERAGEDHTPREREGSGAGKLVCSGIDSKRYTLSVIQLISRSRPI